MTDLVRGGDDGVRVSDAERNDVVDVLRRRCTEGFLTLDEFSDRIGDALNARTRGELAAVVRDLPVAVPQPERGARRKVTNVILAVMGGNRRRGRWRVGDRVTAVAVMGGCEVDLRRAEIDAPVVHVVALAVMGGIDVIVPEGIPVDLRGFSFMGGKHLKVPDVPPLPGAPTIVVHAFPVMGGVHVRTKRPRSPGDGRPRGRERTARSRSRALPEIATGVSRLPPELHGTVTLLFTDVEDSTRLTERLGDAAAHEVLRDHHQLLAAQAELCGGHVVKTQGDGAMIAFAGASQALRCAIATQQAIEEWNAARRDHPLCLRMGLHTGEALRDGDDFGGRAVILAARIATEAAGGEILVSELLHQLTAATGEFEFGPARAVELKGFDGPQTVVPVRW